MTKQELRRRALSVIESYGDRYDQTVLGDEGTLDLDVPAPGRFMLYTSTDGGSDAWVDFFPDEQAVTNAVARCLDDPNGYGEWSPTGIFDLHQEDYLQPLVVSAELRLRFPSGTEIRVATFSL